MVKQHHVSNQVQAIKINSRIYPPLQVWGLNPTSWDRRKFPGAREQMLEEVPPHLLLGIQNQCLLTEQGQKSREPTRISPATIKRRNMTWFDHVARHNSTCKAARPSSKVLLKADATADGNARVGQCRRTWKSRNRENNHQYVILEGGCLFLLPCD